MQVLPPPVKLVSASSASAFQHASADYAGINFMKCNIIHSVLTGKSIIKNISFHSIIILQHHLRDHSGPSFSSKGTRENRISSTQCPPISHSSSLGLEEVDRPSCRRPHPGHAGAPASCPARCSPLSSKPFDRSQCSLREHWPDRTRPIC